MNTEELVSVAGLLLVLAGAAGLTASALRSGRTGRIAHAVMIVSLALLIASFFLRWRHYCSAMDVPAWLAFPVSGFYESIVFCVIVLLATACIMLRNEALASARNWIGIISGAALLAMPLAGIARGPVMFLPSLRSYWLVAHVSLSFIAYCLFALAAVLAVGVLRGKEHFASTAVALIRVATAVFTVGGIMFGSLWAHDSWGRYWAWDPKETWAFITWAYYAALIHLQYRGKLSVRQFAMLAVLGLAVVLFTFIGVNVLVASGLHTYGSLA